MNAFQIAMAQAQAMAQEWTIKHKDELKDVECPEQSYGERKGYEVSLDEMLDGIALEEASHENVWECDSELSYIEEAGQYNVAPLAHWNRKALDTVYSVEDASVVVDADTQTYRDKAGIKSKLITDYIFMYSGNMSIVTDCTEQRSRFNPEKYAKHQRLALKARARHGIEFCYDKAGRVRKALPTDAELVQAKAAKIKAVLVKADRQSQATPNTAAKRKAKLDAKFAAYMAARA